MTAISLPRDHPSSEVERNAAAARLAALAVRDVDVFIGDTSHLVQQPAGLTTPSEKERVEARLAALEARFRAEDSL